MCNQALYVLSHVKALPVSPLARPQSHHCWSLAYALFWRALVRSPLRLALIKCAHSFATQWSR